MTIDEAIEELRSLGGAGFDEIADTIEQHIATQPRMMLGCDVPECDLGKMFACPSRGVVGTLIETVHGFRNIHTKNAIIGCVRDWEVYGPLGTGGAS